METSVPAAAALTSGALVLVDRALDTKVVEVAAATWRAARRVQEMAVKDFIVALGRIGSLRYLDFVGNLGMLRLFGLSGCVMIMD